MRRPLDQLLKPWRVLRLSFVVFVLFFGAVGLGVHALDGGAAQAAEPSPEQPSPEQPSPEQPAQFGALDPAAAPTQGAALVAGADRIHLGETPWTLRVQSAVGVFGLIGLAWLLSQNRRRIDWRLVWMGTGLQLALALLVLKTPFGTPILDGITQAFNKLMAFTDVGTKFLLGSFVANGEVQPALANFIFAVLPTIIFFSSLMTVLYHLNVMQPVVAAFAWAMRRTMRTSGSETASTAANIFLGQTEAPLMVKPYIERMTRSELHAIMVGGFATVAGGVLALYIGFLRSRFPDIAGHLLAASVMAAPATLVISKIQVPETEESLTAGEMKLKVERIDANLIDAAARGASEGMQLAINVTAMLLAFIALVALANYMLGIPSYVQHGLALKALLAEVKASGATLPATLASCDITQVNVPFEDREGCLDQISAAFSSVAPVNVAPVLTFEKLAGWAFWPIAWLMGIPASDCFSVGVLLGQKMVINEAYAYIKLSEMLASPTNALQPRSVVIVTYALCGFANFASIAIQIGGIGAMAPNRRADIARLGLSAMIGGTLAGNMTGAIAGMVL